MLVGLAMPASAGARDWGWRHHAAVQVGPYQTITIVNDAHLNPRLLRRAELAWQIQADQLRRYWHTPRIRFGRGGWVVMLAPIAQLPESATTFGYHWQMPDRPPTALVGADGGMMWQVGDVGVPAWEVYASHELMEMLADPAGAGTEVCDPVEDQAYLIDGIGVSRFITTTTS